MKYILLMLIFFTSCNKQPLAPPCNCMHKGWVHKGYSDKNIFLEQDTTVISIVCDSALLQDEMVIKNILYPIPCTMYDSAGWFLWK